jgi:hypothetical protein
MGINTEGGGHPSELEGVGVGGVEAIRTMN